jgi:hypothetical protein
MIATSGLANFVMSLALRLPTTMLMFSAIDAIVIGLIWRDWHLHDRLA